MLYRAQRIPEGAVIRRYQWEGAALRDDAPHLYVVGATGEPGNEPVPAPRAEPVLSIPSADQEARVAALEREAFTKGYAAGERAGVEAGAHRADAMLRRVAQTIDELAQLRRTITRDTEQQMVQLALALAKRVVLRELSLEPDLVAALAHVAVERLGDQAPATIRLHPEDYSTVVSHRGEQWEGTQVSVTPDPSVPRGGCVVESDFGLIDATVDAQFAELSRALLGDASAKAAPGIGD